MNVLIKHMAMPKGCIYANDKDQTDYCPMLNHDDVPFCQYIENEPESAIGIDERPVYCPLSDVPDTNVGDTISRQQAIDALWEKRQALNDYMEILLQDGKMQSRYLTKIERNRIEEDINIIEDLPSAQPEPKRGKWIDKGITGDWQYQTDGRGRSWHEWQCDQCKDMVKKRSFYCPNCGADMRGEDNETD